MNTKILIAALAGLSVVAAAQSQSDKQKDQASGRLEEKNVVHRDVAARDVASGHATGKKTAQDDWQQTGAKPVSSSSDTKPSHVAVGDVNGDGRADVAVSSKNSAHATEAAASTSSFFECPDSARRRERTGHWQAPASTHNDHQGSGQGFAARGHRRCEWRRRPGRGGKRELRPRH